MCISTVPYPTKSITPRKCVKYDEKQLRNEDIVQWQIQDFPKGALCQYRGVSRFFVQNGNGEPFGKGGGEPAPSPSGSANVMFHWMIKG